MRVSKEISVKVGEGVPPSEFEVGLSAEPVTGSPPLTVTFTGKITGGVDPIEWLLDFKDGGVEWGQPPASREFTVEHTYQNKGAYKVTLGSHDSAGHEAFDSVDITVAEAGEAVLTGKATWFILPILGVSIEVSDQKAVTDSGGKFQVTVPVGTYTIKATHLLFDDYEKEIDLTEEKTYETTMGLTMKLLAKIAVVGTGVVAAAGVYSSRKPTIIVVRD